MRLGGSGRKWRTPQDGSMHIQGINKREEPDTSLTEFGKIHRDVMQFVILQRRDSGLESLVCATFECCLYGGSPMTRLVCLDVVVLLRRGPISGSSSRCFFSFAGIIARLEFHHSFIISG